MELNERIAQMRKQTGLTQEQFGEQLGVSRQAVSKWESGQANPDVGYVTEMCRKFGVSADWLLLGREPGETAQTPSAPPVKEERYCLYLQTNLYAGIAKCVEELFCHKWAVPDFPWEGENINRKDAEGIIEAAPMVLCRGLTRDQAIEAAQIFDEYASHMRVYRESELETDEDGECRPTKDAAPVSVPEKPMSAGMVFGMVVMGVIAAILLMSFC